MTYQPSPPEDQPSQTQWHVPDAAAQPSPAGPAVWIAGLIILALVFVGGLLIGQSGVLDRPTAVAPPSPTPTLAAPASPALTPTPAAASPTPATEPTPAPVPETPAPVVTPRPGHTPGQPDDVPAEFDLFWEALEIIRENFVGRDELADRDVTYGAIRGLVEALGDTGHSVFLTPEALQRERESLSGTIVGVGALLGERAGRPIIVSVISGGPAQRAGLRSGDALLTVDGIDVRQMTPEEIATRVRGEAGTTVVIVVERPATTQQIEFSIIREEIRIPAASWAMVPGTDIAVLRLIQFSDGAAAELERARDEALAAGATAFILDLRSNPGGFVHEAIRVASLFLAEGTVYIRELADGERISVGTTDNVAAVGQPLVVLIDEGTASSSEIVSGAMRSAGRAELVGQTTFGTGTVLLTYELSDGSAVRIAIERWLTPDGELIFGQGIAPTIEVTMAPTDSPVEPDELRDLTPADVPTIADPQLRRAIELLGG
jgi:carboxyl-terminal processing protease